MIKNEHIDYLKVEEMVEGDDEFRTQLFQAIQVAVKELQDNYVNGIREKDAEAIRQARHKIKPTLLMFGLKPLSATLGEGKRLISNGGLDQDFSKHVEEFLKNTNAVIEEVSKNS